MRELFVVCGRGARFPRPCFHAYTEFNERKTRKRRKEAIVFGTLGSNIDDWKRKRNYDPFS